MVEYTIFFATTSGVLVLRFRNPATDNVLHKGVALTPIYNPIAFCCVAGLIVIRSAIAHMLPGFIIILLFGTGALVYRFNWWRKLVGVTAAVDLD
jgi:hypothetical protein